VLQEFVSSLFKNSETKPFFTTSEFWVFVGAEVTALANWLPTGNTTVRTGVALVAAAAYKLSRGLAKAGVKPEP
jgi:hypothetical protein